MRIKKSQGSDLKPKELFPEGEALDDFEEELSIDFFDNQSFQGEEIPEQNTQLETEDEIEEIQQLLEQEPEPVDNPEHNLEHVKNQIQCNLKKVYKYDKTLLSEHDTNMQQLFKEYTSDLKLLDRGYFGVLDNEIEQLPMDALVAQLDAFSTSLKVMQDSKLRADYQFRELLFKAK